MIKLTKAFFNVLLAVSIFFTLVTIQGESYPSISNSDGDQNFIVWGIIIALIVLVIFWRRIITSLVTPSPSETFTIHPLIVIPLGIFCYLFVVGGCLSVLINYFNQYNVTSPIESIKTQIISKEHRSGKGGGWFTYFDIFNQRQVVISSDLYQLLTPNDKVLVKIRKGRFGNYFAIELDVEKDGSYHNLRGR
jgi:hypothetical protein